MNEKLPSIVGPLEDDLVAAKSTIEGAGQGLFFEPTDRDKVIPEGSLLCYYYGHIHNFHSVKELHDKRYLMLVEGDTFVDPSKEFMISDFPTPFVPTSAVFLPARFPSKST